MLRTIGAEDVDWSKTNVTLAFVVPWVKMATLAVTLNPEGIIRRLASLLAIA